MARASSRRGPRTMGRGDSGTRPAPSLPEAPALRGARPAPTSASSATAPSSGRRARDRVGPDAGRERAQHSLHSSGRAGGAGPGAGHCGKGVGLGWRGRSPDGGRRGGTGGTAKADVAFCATAAAAAAPAPARRQQGTPQRGLQRCGGCSRPPAEGRV